ncbi:RNA-directed DNA polymerase, eukaryota, reverse transcriptase zinc-binding domain protein [Tanacetum coccineum]|uniref:RNA-directed DNA polymerase, eukaryota, reverse transcriptase zinc-binding domain protein n=1 Tax=Tanacetum coccineum TaxID=301880 RepID=A0ABQ5H539_9ASTR
MWDSRMFSIDHQVCNRNFLGVIGSWSGILCKVGLLNVYAPQSGTLKDQLWNSIEGVINSLDAIWILFSDFNVVRSQDECFGSSFDASEANSFNEFSWASDSYLSSPDLNLKNKLKKLRLDIKAWTCKRISDKNSAKDDLIRQLGEWDVRAKNGLITEMDIPKREEWIMDLNHLDQIHRDDLKQKYRLKWVAEGDENTNFFHSLLK